MRWSFIIFLLLTHSVWSQIGNDTIQAIQEVTVFPIVEVLRSKEESQVLTELDIDQLQPVDVGELLQKLSGVNIRSYGSLGGLKTISVRSLGANHTSIIADGFPLLNNQTGQINLGQFQVDNIVSAVNIEESRVILNVPISALTNGSSVFLQSFESSFNSQDTLQIRSSFSYGSFDRYDGYLGAKYNGRHLLVGAFGGFRKSLGNYIYNLSNGLNESRAERKNNDYGDYNFGCTIGGRYKKWTTRIGYKKKSIEQGLPGAVILYNQTQDERLYTDQSNVFGDLTYDGRRIAIRFYGSGSTNDLNYVDPTYLNNTGGIDVHYRNNSYVGGISAQYVLRRLLFQIGSEGQVTNLIIGGEDHGQPWRYHNFSLLRAAYSGNFIEAELRTSLQSVSDRIDQEALVADQFKVNPYVKIGIKNIGKIGFRTMLSYRNSFRMPSFNELYYNNIGNTALLPETADQVRLNFSINPSSNRQQFYIEAGGFFSIVNNKILAVPSKNLFNWSMQNVGQVRTYGIETKFDYDLMIKNNWTFGLSGNYTFQHALDYSDRNAVTYQHQIAYVPVHTGNIDFKVSYKSAGVRISNNGVSKRYALNENITQNEVAGFWITDISVFYKWKVLDKHVVDFQASVKNVFNQQYAYIRSFVMPGTNYLFTIRYAFN